MAKGKLGVKYISDGGEIIYLLDTEDNFIRKFKTNISGTMLQYTWRGEFRERLKYASENNTFKQSGLPEVEVKNLYH